MARLLVCLIVVALTSAALGAGGKNSGGKLSGGSGGKQTSVASDQKSPPSKLKAKGAKIDLETTKIGPMK
jgi:hypothetical protein